MRRWCCFASCFVSSVRHHQLVDTPCHGDTTLWTSRSCPHCDDSLRRQIGFVSRMRGRPASPSKVWLMDVSILIQPTTSGYGIHATASRRTPAALDADGMTAMPETPDKCHHTRWQRNFLLSCTRLISQRLGAASLELWSATHWLELWSATHWHSGLHCSHKLMDDLEQLKDPHNGSTC